MDPTIPDTNLLRGPEKGSSGFRQFAELVYTLAISGKTNDKLEALRAYFSHAMDKDKVWVIAIFSGRRPKRAVSSAQLQSWCLEKMAIPVWLFEECYHTVGDLAETIALLLPENEASSESNSLHYYVEKLADLEKLDEAARKAFVIHTWDTMARNERFAFNKLITGGFRIGVSQKIMLNALAKTTLLEPSSVAHRISGNWDPFTIGFEELLGEDNLESDLSKPYPFYLAYALEENPDALGEPSDWFAEWKWDGIRGQLIKRQNQFFVWSRGEELLTEKFPEFETFRDQLPDGVVLDGEIICLNGGKSDAIDFVPLPFAALQTRIGRKNLSRKQLQEAPVGFIAYDLVEIQGEDCRSRPLEYRREQLSGLLTQTYSKALRLSPLLEFNSWEQLTIIRSLSRAAGSEGLMLKRKASAYQTGRKKGDWWKWKIDPMVIDAVMIYAQKGHGRRSNLYTDYTFAVKDGEKLVSFTKAYSGLTDKELNEVDYFVKRNSLEKFGPVRTVRPELVFEIAFEGIAASNRHKSGVALRFPRINRWRKDKKPDEINTLDDLKKMLEIYGK